MKKIISMLVAMVMVITMVPATAWAADEDMDGQKYFLEDGNYYVNMNLWHEYKDQASMGKIAFEKCPKALAKVENGKVTKVEFSSNTVDFYGIISGLIKLTVDGKDTTVLEAGNLVTSEGNKFKYIKRGEFSMPEYAVPTKAGDVTYAKVGVTVPDTPMGEGEINARMKFDWATAEKTTDEHIQLVKTPAAPKTLATRLAKGNGGYNDIYATWSKSEGATGYSVYSRRPGVTSDWTLVTRTTKTSLLKKDLKDGFKYQFKVVPYVTIDGVRYDSEIGKISNTTTTLKKVKINSVKGVNKSKVRVNWANILGETGYQISKAKTAKGINIVATVASANAKSKVISTNRKSGQYYKVRAYKVVNGTKVFAPWSSAKYCK